MTDNPNPRDSYREQRACFNCIHSQWHDKWDDLLCEKWTDLRLNVLGRVEEHGICDLWEGEI